MITDALIGEITTPTFEINIGGAGGGGGALTWDDITGKPSTFPPSSHSHAIADVTNLQTTLLSQSEAIANLQNGANGTITGELKRDLAKIKSGKEEDAIWHLGFYLDENGDLCQVETEE